jgi:hypothetical protein
MEYKTVSQRTMYYLNELLVLSKSFIVEVASFFFVTAAVCGCGGEVCVLFLWGASSNYLFEFDRPVRIFKKGGPLYSVQFRIVENALENKNCKSMKYYIYILQPSYCL